MKRNIKLLLLVASVPFIFLGCRKEEKLGQSIDEIKQTEIEDAQGEMEEDEILQDITENMIVYYIDMDTAEIIRQKIECKNVTPESIWEELRKNQLLTEQCGLNSFEIDESEESIIIDVDKGFGDYVRSMGTSGEEEILSCVFKSYLETYECKKIMITENKQIFGTGHLILDNYIENNY